MAPKLPQRNVKKTGPRLSPAEMIRQQQEQKNKALEIAKKDALLLQERVEKEQKRIAPVQIEAQKKVETAEVAILKKQSRYKIAVSNNWQEIIEKNIQNRNKLVNDSQKTNSKELQTSNTIEKQIVEPQIQNLDENNIFNNSAISNIADNSFELLPQYTNPIVCILGHVDTGKTKILDYLRKTAVQSSEAGGITQQIGATYFPMSYLRTTCGLESPFPGLLIIDTPGHESFNNLRTRGSNLCHVCVLVVDIFHGLENQTIESLELILRRNIPFVIALNKIDRLVGFECRKTKALQKNNDKNINLKTRENSNTNQRNTKKDSKKNKKVFFNLKTQKSITQNHFKDLLAAISLGLSEKGLNSALFNENDDPEQVISLIPTSAITGDGIPDLISEINFICDRMKNKLENQNYCYLNESHEDLHKNRICFAENVTDSHNTDISQNKKIQIDSAVNVENLSETIHGENISNIKPEMEQEKDNHLKTTNKEEINSTNDSLIKDFEYLNIHASATSLNYSNYNDFSSCMIKILAFDMEDKSILLDLQSTLKLAYPIFECTVLETKLLEGHGMTVDCILGKGILKENENIVITSYEEPIVTTIRSILTNDPCKESRVKGNVKGIKTAFGCCGIKIAANGLDKALPGTNIIKIDPFYHKNIEKLFKINKTTKQFNIVSKKNDNQNTSSENGDRPIFHNLQSLDKTNENAIKNQLEDSKYRNWAQFLNFEQLSENEISSLFSIICNKKTPDRYDLLKKDSSISFSIIEMILNQGISVFILKNNEYFELSTSDLKVAKNIVINSENGLEEMHKDKSEIIKLANLSDKGCHVQASTLGSLEALLSYLKIPISSIEIGPLTKKDIKIASSNTDKIILAFDLTISKEILEFGKDMGVKIISANIIYHLLDEYNNHAENEMKKQRSLVEITFPSISTIVKNSIFTKRSPLVLGIEVRGILRIGTEIVAMTEFKDKETEKHVLGKVVSIENNGKPIEKAVTGDKVAIKIETKEIPRVYKKHFYDNSILLSNMRRYDIDQLKILYKDEMKQDDWRVVIELKRHLHII